MEELTESLKKTKNGKATGEDGINSELYKYTGEKFHIRLLNFFNNIYSQAYIPNKWRSSTVLPLYKKGDKRNPNNYRGISLLNTCYKIYAKILNGRLKQESELFFQKVRMGSERADLAWMLPSR